MFWIVYSIAFLGLFYLSKKNFPTSPLMSIMATICMMVAFSPIFVPYNVYKPIVFGFPLWFLVWFVIAVIFVWVLVFYALIARLPDNKELDNIWQVISKQNKVNE